MRTSDSSCFSYYTDGPNYMLYKHTYTHTTTDQDSFVLSPAPGRHLPSEGRLILCVTPLGEPASAAQGEKTDAGFRTSGWDGGQFVRTEKTK